MLAKALWALAGFTAVVAVKANLTSYQVKSMATWYDSTGPAGPVLGTPPDTKGVA